MAEAGHNSQLTDAERKALQFDHFRKIKAQLAKVKEQQAHLKELKGLAKADGFKIADMNFMIKCSEVEDPSIIPDDLKRRMQMASWFNLPVQFQPDLFVDRAPAEEKIEAAGYAAGLEGKNPESGFPKKSSENNQWMHGWERGQAELRDNLKSAMEKQKAAQAEPESGEGDPFPQAAE